MLVLDLVDPVELQAFVRGIDPRAYGFTLDRFLPNQTRAATGFSFTSRDQTRQDVAGYRPFDIEAEIGKRGIFAEVSGKIPPISKKYLVGEKETLDLNAAAANGGNLAEQVAQVYDDAALGVESIQARVELARGEVLTTGKVTFTNDRGLVDAEVDFGAPTAGSAVAAVWTNAGAAMPLEDMAGWSDEYADANQGRRPAVFLTSRARIANAIASDSVKDYLGFRGVAASLVTATELNRALAGLDLPPLMAYDTTVSVAGSNTRVIAANKLLALPQPNVGAFGETLWGVTAEALELVGAGFLQVPTAAGITGVVLKTFDPVAKWTKVSALPLPVLKDPASILQVSVSA